MTGLTTIERAFELARSSPCRTVEEIRRQLAKEGYESVGPHLSGASTRGRLKEILDARKRLTAPVPSDL